MSYTERDSNIPIVPSRISYDVIRSAKKEGSIDRALTHRRLEMICESLSLFEKPRYFTIYDTYNFERTTLLTVPTSARGTSRELFVAVNSESSDLGKDGYEERQLALYAYRWALQERRIARSATTFATRPAQVLRWEYSKEFGPYIVREGDFVTVNHWQADRLELPTQTIGRLSIAGLEELKVAEELINVMNALSPGHEIDDIELFSEEL